ncbi:MAG TPA: T9SS type A sorting domain-containing protein [Ignavibacteria bacterium]|nr:T9SS type A sorting domain-containing protein [Ignavibacteria bacterium]
MVFKKKKQFALIIFILISGNLFAQNFWLPLSAPVERDLRDLYFLDSLRGWVSGDAGVILKTTNGGLNWTDQNSGVTTDIYEIFFLNENLGWAITWNLKFPEYYSIILSTTNGGETWTSARFPVDEEFYYTVRFLNENTGFLGGAPPNNIRRTTNRGVNWLPVTVDSINLSRLSVEDFKFVSPQYGFAAGGHIDIAGLIWKTTNGGLHWRSENVGPEPIKSLVLFDSLNLIGSGGDYEYGSGIVTTTNSGIIWDYRSLETFGIAASLDFRTRAEGWSPLGYAELMIYTTDSSKTWNAINSPDSIAFFELQFTDRRNGYMVGAGGNIYKYNSSLININNNNQFLPVNFSLSQNYPNPFNPSTTIKYSLSNPGFVTLSVYDITGKMIRLIERDVKRAGDYSVTFNANDLSSGIYYYKLTFANGSNSVSETKKMVLMK